MAENTLEIIAKFDAQTKDFEEKLKAVMKAIEASDEKFAGAWQKVDDVFKKTDQDLQRIEGRIVKQFGHIEAAEKKMEKAVKHADIAWLKVGESLSSAGKKLSGFAETQAKVLGGVGAAVAGVGVAAVGMASEWESAFTGVRKTVDASEEEFAQLQKNIFEMSGQMPKSAAELAGIMEIAGQLGIRGVDGLTSFTRTIAMLADTTNIAGEQGALDLARFMNIMGESADQAERLGSVLVALGNKYASQENEILDIGKNLAPFARQIGMTSAQTFALSGVIAASGGEAAAAATAFQKLGLTMKDAVLTGSEDLQVFAQTAGMSTGAFAELFKRDGLGAIKAFLDGLGEIEKRGGSVSAIFAGLEMGDMRLIREIGKVTGNLGQLESAVKDATAAYAENKAMAEEAEKRYKTFASQLSTLKNTFVNLGIQVGLPMLEPLTKAISEQLKPELEALAAYVEQNKEAIGDWAKNAIARAVEKIKEFTAWVRESGPEIMRNVQAVMAWVAQWGPLVVKLIAAQWALGKVFETGGMLIQIFGGLSKGIKLLMATKLWAWLAGLIGSAGGAGALAGFLGVGAAVGAIVLSVVALGETFYKLLNGEADVSNFLSRLADKWEALGNGIDWAMDKLVGYMEATKEFLFGSDSQAALNPALANGPRGLVKGYSRGGIIGGPQGAGDVIPAMLSPGEAVIGARAVREQPDLIRRLISIGRGELDGGALAGLAGNWNVSIAGGGSGGGSTINIGIQARNLSDVSQFDLYEAGRRAAGAARALAGA